MVSSDLTGVPCQCQLTCGAVRRQLLWVNRQVAVVRVTCSVFCLRHSPKPQDGEERADASVKASRLLNFEANDLQEDGVFSDVCCRRLQAQQPTLNIQSKGEYPATIQVHLAIPARSGRTPLIISNAFLLNSRLPNTMEKTCVTGDDNEPISNDPPAGVVGAGKTENSATKTSTEQAVEPEYMSGWRLHMLTVGFVIP